MLVKVEYKMLPCMVTGLKAQSRSLIAFRHPNAE